MKKGLVVQTVQDFHGTLANGRVPVPQGLTDYGDRTAVADVSKGLDSSCPHARVIVVQRQFEIVG